MSGFCSHQVAVSICPHGTTLMVLHHCPLAWEPHPIMESKATRANRNAQSFMLLKVSLESRVATGSLMSRPPQNSCGRSPLGDEGRRADCWENSA